MWISGQEKWVDLEELVFTACGNSNFPLFREIFVNSQLGRQEPQLGILPPRSGILLPQSGILPPQSGFLPPQSGFPPPRPGILPPQLGRVPPQFVFQGKKFENQYIYLIKFIKRQLCISY